MTKLSNNVRYCRNTLPAEFAEYLISNHFKCTLAGSTLEFKKWDLIVLVSNNQINIFKNVSVTNPLGLASQCILDIPKMGIFNWIMLMHILGVQSIAGFVKNTQVESATVGMYQQIESIFESFHSLQF